MKITTQTLIFTISLCLLLFSGCGLLFKPVLVENKNFKTSEIIDPNSSDISISIKKEEDGKIEYTVDDIKGMSINIQKKEPFRIAYHSTKSFNKRAVVGCRINDKNYPALLDSGFPQSALIIAPVHVNENQLPIYFFSDAEGNQFKTAGLALIDDLQIGPLHFHKFPAVCRNKHEQTRLLGLIPLSQDKEIVVPLGVMKQFHYLLFDELHQEVEFSASTVFSPDNKSNWERFRMNIVDDRLLVNIPMINEEIPLILDTGAGAELVVNKAFFEKIKSQNPQAKNFTNFKRSVFFRFMGGNYECREYLMHNLIVSGHEMDVDVMILKNAPNDLFNLSEGLIGPPFFKRSVFVLDFKNNLLWVKKAKGSRFEE